MKQILFTVQIELLKLKRLKIVWITFGLFAFIPLMFGLMLYISMHPESAANVGMFALKAKMFGSNDWSGYVTAIIQAGAGLGFIGTGFVFSYIFGREYTDKTFKDLLALPISRTYFIIAKSILGIIWSFLLFVTLITIGIIVGKVLGVQGNFNEVFNYCSQYFKMTVSTILVSLPITYFASKSQGIIAPLGFCILTLIFSNLIVTMGIGTYFPWAIPGLIGMNIKSVGLQVNYISYIILFVTGIIGFVMTVQYWNKADHK